ncbi:MAG: glycoside hydrolase family 27 protein [Lachnospiraceae bacterium]|nr:glycoside hydrolase family 27 protein [Lachnospiraceae bacterium]
MKKYAHAPMGWNSWDCYGAAVTEDIVRQNAEYMAKNLKQYGWEYIVVDIEWYEPLASSNEYHPFADLCIDEYSRVIPAVNRFPSAANGAGFKPLADYIHSLGLKFGIHIMRGIPRQAVHQNLKIKGTDKRARDVAKTDSICVWNSCMYGVNPANEGAKEYYDSIFELYASWDVDFIKCDDICRELPKEESELIMMSDSLRNCGRDMIFSLSPGPALLEKSELYKATANMWRITDDFWDEWRLLYNMFERAEKWSIHTGADHWPDADMLPVGAIRQCYNPDNRTNFTEDEQITMMNLWCMMRSPLMMGGELTKNDEFTLKLLTNSELIDMFTNIRHSHQVFRKEINGSEIAGWIGVNDNAEKYVGLFNIGENDTELSVSVDDFELSTNLSATDIWTKEKLSFTDSIKAELKAHASVIYKISR